MNLRLAVLPWALRGGLRYALLDELARVTSGALGGTRTSLAGLGWHARLERYARSTAAHAGALIERGDPAAVEAAARDLRRGAHDLGARARRLLGLRDDDEALRALCVCYAQIGIDAMCAGGCELTVGHCLFAAHFDHTVCRLIEALDDGFASGLSGGRGLRFSRRITAGDGYCLARLQGVVVR